jgi:putative phosphoesterase
MRKGGLRLAVLADIHGNLPALEATLADADHRGFDHLVIAGDFTGGPWPNAITDLLRTRDAVMIRGNNEDYLLAFANGTAPEEWQNRAQWASIRCSCDLTDRSIIDFAAGLPEQRIIDLDGKPPIRLVHGSPQNISDGIYPDRDPKKLDGLLHLVKEPVLICGHTHRPWSEEHHDTLAFNPGSAGLSCNGDPRAHYALLFWEEDRWQVEHCAVPYDTSLVRAAYVDTGLLEKGGGFSRASLLCVETGQPVALHLVLHARAIAEKAELKNCHILPDDLWAEAVSTFDWDSYLKQKALKQRRSRTFFPYSLSVGGKDAVVKIAQGLPPPIE